MKKTLKFLEFLKKINVFIVRYILYVFAIVFFVSFERTFARGIFYI